MSEVKKICSSKQIIVPDRLCSRHRASQGHASVVDSESDELPDPPALTPDNDFVSALMNADPSAVSEIFNLFGSR